MLYLVDVFKGYYLIYDDILKKLDTFKGEEVLTLLKEIKIQGLETYGDGFIVRDYITIPNIIHREKLLTFSDELFLVLDTVVKIGRLPRGIKLRYKNILITKDNTTLNEADKVIELSIHSTVQNVITLTDNNINLIITEISELLLYVCCKEVKITFVVDSISNINFEPILYYTKYCKISLFVYCSTYLAYCYFGHCNLRNLELNILNNKILPFYDYPQINIGYLDFRHCYNGNRCIKLGVEITQHVQKGIVYLLNETTKKFNDNLVTRYDLSKLGTVTDKNWIEDMKHLRAKCVLLNKQETKNFFVIVK